MDWKPIIDGADLPDQAGVPFLATVENPYGQLSVTTCFIGYGDGKIYTTDHTHAGGRNTQRLADCYRLLAWKSMPEAYNPYLIDIRYLVTELRRLAASGIGTIDIERELIPRIEDHILADEPNGQFYRAWKKSSEKKKY